MNSSGLVRPPHRIIQLSQGEYEVVNHTSCCLVESAPNDARAENLLCQGLTKIGREKNPHTTSNYHGIYMYIVVFALYSTIHTMKQTGKFCSL